MAAALESCGGSGPTGANGLASALPVVTGTVSGSTISVTVTNTALASAGGLALVKTSAGDVLVARTGTDTATALSSGCTHQNCEITGYAGQVFVCPCHGSQFDTSGRVVQGPAASPLRQFACQISGDVLTITA